MPHVVLYDIPSKPPHKSWSYNPWKSRLALNYKGVDYSTEWVEYPDLKPTFESLGLPPNDPNSPGYFTNYSSPTVRFPDGTIVMDSWKIIHEIEKLYPEPSLHLDEPIVIDIRDRLSKLLEPLRSVVTPKVPQLLQERSREYFAKARAERVGMSLEEYEKSKDPEQCWAEVQQPAKDVADLLKKKDGPFFLGNTVSYADFILVSFLHFLGLVHRPSFERFIALDESFEKLYQASQEWLQKDY